MMKHVSAEVLAFSTVPKASTAKKAPQYSTGPLGIDSLDLIQRGLLTDLAAARSAARRLILGVTILSVIVDVALAAIGVVLASERGSAAIYAFAAECLLDLISSAIVVWQFQGSTSKHKEFLFEGPQRRGSPKQTELAEQFQSLLDENFAETKGEFVEENLELDRQAEVSRPHSAGRIHKKGKRDSQRLVGEEQTRRACSLLGVLFVVSGVGVVIKALTGIIQREHPVTMPLLVVLSSVAATVCASLALVKLWAARRVTMLACGVSAHSLALDAIGSLLSAFCALAALIGAAAYQRRHTLWFLDSAMTSLAGLVMIAIGGRVMYQHGIH